MILEFILMIYVMLFNFINVIKKEQIFPTTKSFDSFLISLLYKKFSFIVSVASLQPCLDATLHPLFSRKQIVFQLVILMVRFP
jgi:hypothetical protein